MAGKPSSLNFDATGLLDDAVSQFRGLNPSEPGQWPWMPKLAVGLAAVAGVVLVGWFVMLTGATDELQAERDREPGLRQDYRGKLAQAVNLSELRKQKLHRHFGIGCDQILLVKKSNNEETDFRYLIFNADGGEVEQCGNGRCSR